MLFSILEDGSISKYTKEFFNLLKSFASGYIKGDLNKSYGMREFLCNRYGLCSDGDIAIDCIAELFEERDGKFYQINNFFPNNSITFEGKTESIENTNNEIIILKLRKLVSLSASQRLYELKYPEYALKRKTVLIAIERNDIFQIITYKDSLYISVLDESQINFDLPQMEDEVILFHLLGEKFSNPSTPAVMKKFFEILNSEQEFCKAVKLNNLISILVKFDTKRIPDFEESTNSRSQIMFIEEFKENFDKLLIEEQKIFKNIIYLQLKYIFTCNEKKIKFDSEQYDNANLLIEIMNLKKKPVELYKLLIIIFKSINLQKTYCFAVRYKILLNTLITYYLALL